MSARPLRVVGRPVPRVDALEKVTGRARYVTDLTMPGMVHAKVLRSPYAHARVTRVDVTRARALPGVIAALAGADVTWCDPYYGPAYRDRPVLALDVARYEGEPVAAVAAVDEGTAEAALELIDVDYEPLTAVMTLEEALAPGAPLVHAGQPPAGHFRRSLDLAAKPGTNVCHQFHFARGNTADALAGADVVVEDAYRFPPVQHVALEPHAVLAAWDESGALTLWASTQNPYSCASSWQRCSTYRCPASVWWCRTSAAASAARPTRSSSRSRRPGARGRPTRAPGGVDPEAFQTVRRCASRVAVRVGFRRDGSLVAVECDASYDVGAYADIGPRVVQKGTYTATGPYRVPHVTLDSRAVYTNTTPGGAFRGFGVPQLAWALESLFDVAAARLDRDPVDLRRQNFLAHGRSSRRATRRSTASSRRVSAARPRRSAGRKPAPPTAAAACGDAEGVGGAERVGGDRAPARRRQRHRARERCRDGPGHAHGARADRGRSALRSARSRDGRTAGHRGDPVRSDHELEPVDRDDGPGGAGRRRGRARAALGRGGAEPGTGRARAELADGAVVAPSRRLPTPRRWR
jgi:CO/xanthine dehydrogenase Mo-binding subunit